MVETYSYNWLKKYLGEQAPSPDEVVELLGAHAFEVESVFEHDTDTEFELKILPDRGSDCLSQRGVAREIASITGVPLTYDPLHTPVTLSATDRISVTIENPEDCPRFTACLISGVKVMPSPVWLKEALESLGQRSINNIVDITNYIMYETGQPIHAYDAGKFPQAEGGWQFAVRRGKEGETVSLLAEGGKQEDRVVTTTGSELLIVDSTSGVAAGLAGVKGGRFAGVDETTTSIIIEAAHFHPGLTRRTARKLGIVIDASKRFENEPSRNLPPIVQQLTADMVVAVHKEAGIEATVEGMVDVYPSPKHPPEVAVSLLHINARLGLSLKEAEVVSILERIGTTVTVVASGEFRCVGPFERTDLNIEEDFIEEVGRIHGYHDVASVVPQTVPLAQFNARHYYAEAVRELLLAQGFSEVITSSFKDKDTITLLSALASDKSSLRSSLLPSLDDALTKNAPFADLLGTSDTRIFEIGTVFTKADGAVVEHVEIAFGVRLKTSGYTGKEDKIVAATTDALEAIIPKDCWVVTSGIAVCNFTALLETLPAPTSYQAVAVAAERVYKQFSLYPSMSRDIALWVPAGTLAAVVEAALNAAAGPLRVRTTLFDEFSKDGRTSFAFRLVFQSFDKTLSDEEDVAPVMAALSSMVAAKGWEVR